MQPTEELNPLRPTREFQTPLSAALEAIQDGIAVIDREGRVVTANSALFRILGLDAAHHPLLSLNLSYLHARFQLFTDTGPLAPELMPSSRALRGEKFQDFELRCRRTDTGEEITLGFSG